MAAEREPWFPALWRWLRRKPKYEVHWSDGLVWVGVPRRSTGASEVLADGERTLTFSRENPERVGEVTRAHSVLTVVADYGPDDRLCGLELIGVPMIRTDARTALSDRSGVSGAEGSQERRDA